MANSTQRTLTLVAESLIERGQMLAVAESCTGGWLAKVCTDLPGSSQWFERGIVSYSNEAKSELLGVPAETIREYGAVSEPVVTAMAEGLIRRSHAHWGIAISGVAGPDGGTEINPVGTVWFAWLEKAQDPMTSRQQFAGDRNAVREQSVEFALIELNKYLK